MNIKTVSSKRQNKLLYLAKRRQKAQVVIWAIISIISFLILWQLIVSFTGAGKLVPGPFEVFPSFFASFVTPIGQMALPGHILASLIRVIVGYLLAAIVGIVIGILMGTSPVARAIIKPIFEVIRPIPGIAWIPLAILWFGIGEVSKIFIIFISAAVVVTLNAFEGALTVDSTLIGAAKMLGADKRQVFFRIVLPSCVPQIFAGLQTALSVSWMVVLAAEMVRSEYGVGWLITTGSDSGNMTQVIIGMIAIGIVGLILANVLRGTEKRLCAWKEQGV